MWFFAYLIPEYLLYYPFPLLLALLSLVTELQLSDIPANSSPSRIFELHKTTPYLIKNCHSDVLFFCLFIFHFQVVDPDTEEILGPNEEGELRVKSLSIMNGYYNRDSTNRYDSEGWFRTGDVVRYDDNCFFYVVDRVKEMLKYRGWHIPPAILELELSQHPAVRQSVVIGE